MATVFTVFHTSFIPPFFTLNLKSVPKSPNYETHCDI